MWIHEYVLLCCSFFLSFSLLSNIKFCYFSIKATKTQLIWTIPSSCCSGLPPAQLLFLVFEPQLGEFFGNGDVNFVLIT